MLLPTLIVATVVAAQPLLDRVEHHHADHDGVKIHYVTLGEGPLVVMIHGFPDYWYTWRHQMDALADGYRVAAMDLRGYNRSDKPAGVEQYDMSLLVGDVAAVIEAEGRETAVICGHDWGGAIAWSFAAYRPEMTDRLIVCNLPHPDGIRRELATNRTQQKNSGYARRFQQPGAHETLTAEGLAAWVRDDDARPHYVEAFRRSDFEAMLNYYKRNYPAVPEPAEGEATPAFDPTPTFPRIARPVLVIHGLKDPYLLAAALNDTWTWLDADLTLVTVPQAGHFVQFDEPDLVSRSIRAWLDR